MRAGEQCPHADSASDAKVCQASKGAKTVVLSPVLTVPPNLERLQPPARLSHAGQPGVGVSHSADNGQVHEVWTVSSHKRQSVISNVPSANLEHLLNSTKDVRQQRGAPADLMVLCCTCKEPFWAASSVSRGLCLAAGRICGRLPALMLSRSRWTKRLAISQFARRLTTETA